MYNKIEEYISERVLVVQEMKILLVCWHTGTIFGNTEYALYVYLERLVSMCMRSSACLNRVTLLCILYLFKSENHASVPVYQKNFHIRYNEQWHHSPSAP